MTLAELEHEVSEAVATGRFQEYAQERLWELRGVERETEIDVLWLAVRNARERKYYDAAQVAFDHRREFRRHGVRALKSEELLPINRELAYETKPFQEALQRLQEYRRVGQRE